MLLHAFLALRLCVEKSAGILIYLPLYVICHFTFFKILSVFCTISVFIIICLFFFLSCLFGVWKPPVPGCSSLSQDWVSFLLLCYWISYLCLQFVFILLLLYSWFIVLVFWWYNRSLEYCIHIFLIVFSLSLVDYSKSSTLSSIPLILYF
jgi:hypothetical protein